MQELQQHTGKLKIENYGLWEFLQDFHQGVNQGYELDDSNEGFPQVFGSLYTCLLKKKSQDVLPEKQADQLSVLPVDEVKDVLVIAPWSQTEVPVVAKEATIVAKQETLEVEQPAKRGPKPKN